MKKLLFLLFIANILTVSHVNAQEDSLDRIIAFYNVENLFHPSDDSLTADEDFTPTGLYHWTYGKYFHKISNVGKVFIDMGKGSPPAIIGLAEIECEQVLKDLCYRSPLKRWNYKYVHYDSPDRRGVDVGLLYRPDMVNITQNFKIPVQFPFEPETRNRDILYVCAKFSESDSVHLLVNHWTSRYGGYAGTIPKRNYYADVVRSIVDSLLLINSNANILIMGDFNDYVTDESMQKHLRVKRYAPSNVNDTIFDLMYRFLDMNNVGSHKHEDFWGCLDQIIVSRNLLFTDCGLRIANREANIFGASFLLVPDEKYGGVKTYRTFLGPRYIGGFADHLPVYVIMQQ